MPERTAHGLAAIPPEENSVLYLHVPGAAAGWGLLLQSGVLVNCRTGIPLEQVFEELGLDREQRGKLDVYFLDGKAVDDPGGAIVRDGSRLALAAGLPGIVGLAMRGGSAVAALRPGVSHLAGEGEEKPVAAPGRIELALFSLALPLLAAHMLRRGVLVTVRSLLPYLRPALLDMCFINSRSMNLQQAKALLAGLPPSQLVLLTASARGARTG